MNAPGFDLSDALLSVTWRSVGTHQVLGVYDDRSAWYWAMATLGPGSDVVGSFRTEVPAGQWAAIEAAAAAVARFDQPAATGALGLTITARGVTGWVALGTDDAGGIGGAVLPVVEAARSTPVAAARLEARVLTAPTGQRVAGFTLASIGDRPVSLRIDPEGFLLSTPAGGGDLLPAPRMGLVDAAGHLLDGLYQTAEIPPGALGACTIVLTEAPAEPPTLGAIRGSLTLVGPWPIEPIEAFEASSTVLVAAPK